MPILIGSQNGKAYETDLKGRYAVTAMLDVALHAEQGPVPWLIFRSQGISLSYLEQLFARLRKHGLVSSVRGRAAVIASVWRRMPSRSVR